MNWNEIYALLKRKHRACYLKLLTYFYQIEIKSIVEVGVFRGKNAEVLREMFPKAHLYLVDPWKPTVEYLQSGSAVSQDPSIYEKGLRRVKQLFKTDPQVTILKKCSHEAFHDVPNFIDLVFIDANHAYPIVKQDILIWNHKVRQGGVLSGHNYGRKRLPGVKRAVDELFGNELFLGQDEVWAHIKKCKPPFAPKYCISKDA